MPPVLLEATSTLPVALKTLQILIATLSKSKTMSKAIGERLADSKSTKQQMEEARERYRPLAVRGSLLYFTVAELCKVDVMYQYSLDYFQVQNRVLPVYSHHSVKGRWATLTTSTITKNVDIVVSDRTTAAS